MTPHTALVVDDDPDIRKIISVWLKQLGFQVEHAADGRSAMSSLEKSPPALLCLDLMLPESSGYDVCEFIQRTESLKGVRVLMISARSLPEDRAIAEELGCRAYLPKPFTQADFVRHVGLAMEGDGPESC